MSWSSAFFLRQSISHFFFFSKSIKIIIISYFLCCLHEEKKKKIRNTTSSLENLFVNDMKIFISKYEKTENLLICYPLCETQVYLCLVASWWLLSFSSLRLLLLPNVRTFLLDCLYQDSTLGHIRLPSISDIPFTLSLSFS